MSTRRYVPREMEDFLRRLDGELGPLGRAHRCSPASKNLEQEEADALVRAQNGLVRVGLAGREEPDVPCLHSNLTVPHPQREGALEHVDGVTSGAPVRLLEPFGELEQSNPLGA